MGTDEQLVALHGYLDLVDRRLSDLYVLNSDARSHQQAIGRGATPEHIRRASETAERARVYAAAARTTLEDASADLGSPSGRANQDLRLLRRLLDMVDELAGEAARHLAAADRDVESGVAPSPRPISPVLTVDQLTLAAARRIAQAGARLASRLTVDGVRVPRDLHLSQAEHERRQVRPVISGLAGPTR